MRVESGEWRTVAIPFDELGDVAGRRGKRKQEGPPETEASWRDVTALLLIGRRGDEMTEVRWADGR